MYENDLKQGVVSLEEFWDLILDTLSDSVQMLPFLFAAYLLIEFLEHKASDKLQNALSKSGNHGIVVGAILGTVPQCGFSVAAANLYSGKVITLGTLIAVFISTSDEAIPVLLSSPGNAGVLLKLIIAKIVIALIAGFLVDFVLKARHVQENEPELQDHNVLCHHCGCEHGIIRSAIKHTVSIFLFILLVSFVLNGLITWIGQDTISKVLLTDSVFQPFIAALIGLIPNCAASVMLVQLFLAGSLSFGSVVAGLCTGAGIGLAVLFRANRNWKKNLLILLLLYGIGSISGLMIHLFI